MKQNLETDKDNIDAHWNGQIILIGNDRSVREQVLHIIDRAGGRIVNPMPIDCNLSDIEKRVNAIAIVIHVSDWNEAARRSLSSVEKYCLQYDLPMLILLPLGLLDFAITAVEYPNAEFLMTDGNDDFSAELLVTLNNRVIETTSATFSNRDEPNANSSVSDDPFGFKAQDKGSTVPYGDTSGKTQSANVASAEQIRNLIKARRLRDHYFDAELFADPAWDMLLDLMAARLENIKVSVSSLCIAAGVPPTTALRWIKTMTEEKIFERIADETDGRRIFIQLSDDSASGMAGFFSTIRRNNLMMV